MLPMDNKKNPQSSPFVKSAAQPAVSSPSKSEPVMKSFSDKKEKVTGGKAVLTLVLMILLGVGVGYGASLVSAKTGTSIVPGSLNPNAPQKGKTYGNGDPSVFKDTA